MQYPNISEYVSAIRNSSENFDRLAYLKPVLDNHGEPFRSVGGFAVVFKMEDVNTGKYYAIKCFHAEQDDRKIAYEEIGKVINKNKSRYLLDVNYWPKELFVDTKVSNETEYPVLQMDWIEGETMESYILSYYRDKDAMKQLYLKFCDMALWLRSKPFAHGDIKPDNIMIRTDGSLTLIDYDGMFVPSLKGSKSPTIGTKGFSHPLRTGNDFNENIDDFALASISISLLAMSEDVNLYEEYCGKDRLLFSDKDYHDFTNSEIYNKLVSLGGTFPLLLEIFHQCLTSNDECTSLYDQIFDLQTKAPEIIKFESVSSGTIYADDEISLSWEVKNGTKLTINGKDVSDYSIYKAKPKQTCEYELIVTNGLKESSAKIKINVLPKPTIIFRSDKTKLRKGKDQSVRVYWSVNNATNATLVWVGNIENVRLNGEKNIIIDAKAEIKLNVLGLDKERIFSKSIKINIFSESEVTFTADKIYSLPNVPIKLTWNIRHAKEATISTIGKVSLIGDAIVSPKESTTYILAVKDAFGESEYPLKIQMLPLPYIKALNIPTPKFNNEAKITVEVPKPIYISSMPDIKVMGVELNTPHIPSLEESGIKVDLSNRIDEQISIWQRIKNIYSYFISKLSK
ncbi:MAG: protein kinase family protein [Bacteroidaceae bacterium]|nr:protein kinase family protein [Bacteroidaceae bacterium]